NRPTFLNRIGWLEEFLTDLRHHSIVTHGTSIPRTMFSVPSSATPLVRARCRELAQRSGWDGARTVSDHITIPRAQLGNSEQLVTILLCQIDFEGIDLSLVTVLKGVVRPLSWVRLGCLGHRQLDELILGGCLEGLDLDPPESDVVWTALWSDACKLRLQL